MDIYLSINPVIKFYLVKKKQLIKVRRSKEKTGQGPPFHQPKQEKMTISLPIRKTPPSFSTVPIQTSIKIEVKFEKAIIRYW